MKKKSLFRITLIQHFAWLFDTCVTKLRMVISIFLSALLLISCTQGDTKNYYLNPTTTPTGSPTGQNSMSGGGGATGDGGGGQGVLCGETKNPAIRNKLWVRDIYEAVSNHNLEMKKIENNVTGMEVTQEAYNTLVTSIQSYLGPATPNIDFAYQSFWKKFVDQISFLDEDKVLYTSQDANSPIALPAECKLVQIAYWDESSGPDAQGTLYVSKPLWEQLDQINKIGLLAHEHFFKQARTAKYKNSDYTRYKVGQLLSTTGLTTNFDQWMSSNDKQFKNYLPLSRSGFKFCQGFSDEDPTAKVQFYQYEGSDSRQHLVFPIISSKQINSNVLQKSHFIVKTEKRLGVSKKEEVSYRFTQLSDLLVYFTDFPEQTSLSKALIEENVGWLYDNTGLLSDRGSQGFTKAVDELSSKDGKFKEAWWEEKLQTPQEPIVLSLLDPQHSSDGTNEKTLKKRGDLVAAVNQKIRSLLMKCEKLGTSGISLDSYNSAIASLHSEVSQSTSVGNYLDLKRWKSYLENLQEEVRIRKNEDNVEYDSAKCDFISNRDLVEEVPRLLYNLKINNYTQSEAESLLGEDAYNLKNGKISPLRKRVDILLKVTQGTTSLNFNLKCSNYISTFGAYTKRVKKIEKYSLAPNKNLKLIANSSNSDSENSVTTIETMESLSKFLTSDVTQFIDGIGGTSCASSTSILPRFLCEDYFLFAEKLSTENKGTIKNCTTLGYKDDDSEYRCSIVSFDESKMSFAIRYQAINMGDPKLLLPFIKQIRLIPNN